jgi:hypothetical protein
MLFDRPLVIVEFTLPFYMLDVSSLWAGKGNAADLLPSICLALDICVPLQCLQLGGSEIASFDAPPARYALDTAIAVIDSVFYR